MWGIVIAVAGIVVWTIIEWAKEKSRPIKIGLVLFALIGIVGAGLAFQENRRLSSQLGQIGDVKTAVDSLTNVQKELNASIRIATTAVESLRELRKSLTAKVRLLEGQHDSLLSVNDSLIRLAQVQLSGRLSARFGQSVYNEETGSFTRVDRFQSEWPQDLQNILIRMRFDGALNRVVVSQETSSALFVSTCRYVDTSISRNEFDYFCPFLAKGYWIMVKTFSKKPLQLLSWETQPPVK